VKIEYFDYFYNKDKGKKCLILGAAPSINNIDYKNFDGIIISMGDLPVRLQDECNIDYWINANPEFPIPDVDYEKINKVKNTTLLFAHSVVRKLDYSVIRNKLKINWFEYDQRHFGGRPCNNQIDYRFDWMEKQECCNYIGDTTIQEFLQEKYNTIDHYSTASTVSIHALSLAIILGCKTIYIGGVEIPINQNDYNHYGTNSLINLLMGGTGGKRGISKYTIRQFLIVAFNLNIKSVFYPSMADILKDFEFLNNLCRHNDISLYNLSETSSLKKIPNFKYLNPDQINLM
jgi:hypothetical protein